MGPAEQRLRQLAYQSNRRYVSRRGNTSAPCAILGEAPGADEEAQGIPFIGASGSLLTKMAGEAGFSTHDYWVSNIYKVRPPDNELWRLNELGIPADAFHDDILEELYAYKPQIIVACGATPTGFLCPDTLDRKTGSAAISKWRGSLLQSPKLNWPHYVIPVIHPAAVLREWSERPVAVFCLAKAQEELAYLRKNGKLQPLPSRQLIVDPSAQDLKDYLTEVTLNHERVSNDIETIYGKYPYTISLARSPWLSISFSFWDYVGSDGVQIWRLLDRILRENRTIGQNYVGFDCHMLESLGFAPNVDNVDDTLVRHHVLWPEFEHKLQFLGMQYTREPYWKDEGKEWSPREGKHRLMRYNALDSAGTYEVFLGQEEEYADKCGIALGKNELIETTLRDATIGLDALTKAAMRLFGSVDKLGEYIASLTNTDMAKLTSRLTSTTTAKTVDVLIQNILKPWQLANTSKPKAPSFASSTQKNGLLQPPPVGIVASVIENEHSAITMRERAKNLHEFYRYEMRLDRALFHVENRGLLVDRGRLAKLRDHVLREIDKHCEEAERIVGRPTAAIKECRKCKDRGLKDCGCGLRTVKKVATLGNCKQDSVFNIASAKQLITEFELRGVKVPHKRGAKGSKGNKTVDEEALLRIALNNNQMLLPQIVIKVRELNKIRSVNLDAKLYEDTLFCSYGTTGTDTGRRNSTENIFGFGGNMQNIPKHTELGLRYRECLVARPGNVFVECDQKGAEDWIVQAIIVDNGGSDSGLRELKAGINRHKKLAAFLFAKPENEIDKAGIHYYAGKKTRHAGNYDMQADKMSIVILVETGLNMPTAYTQWLLNKFHEFDPGIRGVFHKYVQDQLSATRTLRTPLGRERVFFGLRPGSNNADVFRKGYAFIPQSTVGDNTGMSIVWLTDRNIRVVEDNHDAVTTEVKDENQTVLETVELMQQSFDRDLVFPNGTIVNVPVEFSIGFDKKNMISIKNHNDRNEVLKVLEEARKAKCPEPLVTTVG